MTDKKKKKKNLNENVQIEFRERNLSEVVHRKLNHPRPIPGYKATLPGPPGWDSKENPLGLRIPQAKTRKRNSVGPR